MWMRAARSAFTSSALRQSVRQRLVPSPTSPFLQRALSVSLNAPPMRSFSAEPGFPDRADVSSRVLEVVRKFEKVQPEKVTESSHFVNDLGLDSLDTVELVMALEDEFALEITDVDAEKILSCSDAVEYLANNVNAK